MLIPGLIACFQGEEPRDIRGARGVPGTVAPFRAWRGSRDLVAQSPKFHAPAAAKNRGCEKSLARRREAPKSQRQRTSQGCGEGNMLNEKRTLRKTFRARL